MDNRSHQETDWDLDLLGPELKELKGLDFDLAVTGFDDRELEDLLADPDLFDQANFVPDVPENPVTRPVARLLDPPHSAPCLVRRRHPVNA
jgi:hypothetical protein